VVRFVWDSECEAVIEKLKILLVGPSAPISDKRILPLDRCKHSRVHRQVLAAIAFAARQTYPAKNHQV